MVKLTRKVDQWLLVGRGIELAPTDIDAHGIRLLARGRTLGGPDDGSLFERAVELAVGQSAHFGPHVAVTLLEVRGESAKLGVLAPSNVPVLAKEQFNEDDARNDRP